jgi:replicative DNA helicase
MRPTLARLMAEATRASGTQVHLGTGFESIEQDADVVAFIYRDSYYKERTRPPENEVDKFQKWKNEMQQVAHKAEFIIAKQRNGPVGSVELFFDAEFTRFGNLDVYHN